MAKKKISKDKIVHPYSRKAKQLRRELCKTEKVKPLNPLKELLLHKFRIFKKMLETQSKPSLTFSDIDQVLSEYFKADDYLSVLVERELKSFESGHGIELPKVTCGKLCKRLLNLSKIDWSSIESLDLFKYYK